MKIVLDKDDIETLIKNKYPTSTDFYWADFTKDNGEVSFKIKEITQTQQIISPTPSKAPIVPSGTRVATVPNQNVEEQTRKEKIKAKHDRSIMGKGTDERSRKFSAVW